MAQDGTSSSARRMASSSKLLFTFARHQNTQHPCGMGNDGAFGDRDGGLSPAPQKHGEPRLPRQVKGGFQSTQCRAVSIASRVISSQSCSAARWSWLDGVRLQRGPDYQRSSRDSTPARTASRKMGMEIMAYVVPGTEPVAIADLVRRRLQL